MYVHVPFVLFDSIICVYTCYTTHSYVYVYGSFLYTYVCAIRLIHVYIYVLFVVYDSFICIYPRYTTHPYVYIYGSFICIYVLYMTHSYVYISYI